MHRWDARCKVLAILTITFCMLYMSVPALAIYSLFLALLLPAVGLSGGRLARELRVWWWLLILIFLAEAIFEEGQRLSAMPWLPVTDAGVTEGLKACWRFALVVGFGSVFTAATRHREVGDALRSLLACVGIPAAPLAFMASLTVRFLPLLLDMSDRIREAGLARASDNRLRPIRRMRALVFPLMRNTLIRSEDLSMALAARGFDERRVRPLPKLKCRHVLALIVFAVTVVASLFLA